MGKHLLSSEKSTVQFQDNHPGCMWGILQILDYHHWHNFRNVFPHKKHYWGRHARHNRKNLLHNQGEDQQFGLEEAEPLLVRQHSQKLNAAGKSSTKSSKKGSRTENSSKDQNNKEEKFVQCKACGTRDTIDYSGQNQVSSEYALHLEKDGEITQAALNQKLMEAKNLKRDTSIKFKKHPLEVFRVEKDLLVKFLRELDVGGKNFRHASNNKARLTKSGSFPVTTKSQMRNISPSTLEHKQNEIWAFPKGENLLAGTQSQNMFASSLAKDISYVKPMAVKNDLGVVDSAIAMKQKPSSSSSSYSEGLNHKGWNQLVLHRFKVIKQKIKHALTEFKKSGYQTSVEDIHHRAPSKYSIANNEKEVSQSIDDGMIQEYVKNRSTDETIASDYDPNKHQVRLIRRASSVTESMDRYTQLFEQSFRKDIKWHSSMSKSLKLANEDKNNMRGCAPKFSRRNMSLPNLDSLGFVLLEALFDSNDIGITVETDIHVQRKSVSLPLNKDTSLDHITETEMDETVESGGRDVKSGPSSGEIVEKNDEEVNCDHRKDTLDPAVEDGSYPQEKVEISMTMYPSKEAMATLETSCEDNDTSHAEGRELSTKGSSMLELETDLPNRGSVYSWPDSLCNTNASPSAKDTKVKSDTDIDSNFKYVKDVLEFLGFMGNEDSLMWHTIDQPLKPSLLMDLDGSLHHEIQSSGEETINPYHHRLLFNLVNEVLLEIYERSPTCFARPFSFNSCLRSMHKGHYLLNEVWTRVNSYLSLRPELDQTLDDVVGRDLAKSSGWMNLQREEECVALELGEMIVKDLLDEVIFS